MRFQERQEKETQKAWEAFKVYRDLGHERTHLKVAELVGKTPGYCRTLERWSSKNDWVARAQAYDDYMEMLKQGAIEEHEKKRATETAERKAKLEDKYLEFQELMMEQSLIMARWPLKHEQVLERYPDGRIKTVKIKPARWSQSTAGQRLEQLNPNPDKIAFTDPSGEYEYRADQPENVEDVKRWFREELGVEIREDTD